MEIPKDIQPLLLKKVNELTTDELKKVTAIPRNEVVNFQLANGFKIYNAQEGREKFPIVAKDMEDAREQASLWNAVVIGVSRKKSL